MRCPGPGGSRWGGRVRRWGRALAEVLAVRVVADARVRVGPDAVAVAAVPARMIAGLATVLGGTRHEGAAVATGDELGGVAEQLAPRGLGDRHPEQDGGEAALEVGGVRPVPRSSELGDESRGDRVLGALRLGRLRAGAPRGLGRPSTPALLLAGRDALAALAAPERPVVQPMQHSVVRADPGPAVLLGQTPQDPQDAAGTQVADPPVERRLPHQDREQQAPQHADRVPRLPAPRAVRVARLEHRSRRLEVEIVQNHERVGVALQQRNDVGLVDVGGDLLADRGLVGFMRWGRHADLQRCTSRLRRLAIGGWPGPDPLVRVLRSVPRRPAPSASADCRSGSGTPGARG